MNAADFPLSIDVVEAFAFLSAFAAAFVSLVGGGGRAELAFPNWSPVLMELQREEAAACRAVSFTDSDAERVIAF